MIMKKTFILFLTLGFLMNLGAYAQEKTNLELTDLFNMEYVSDPQISPDGTQIVFVRNFKDIMTDRDYSNLWISNIDGSRIRQLTQGNQRDYAPRWSNDGKKLAFLSNQQDDKVKLFLMHLDTRETAALTNTSIPPGAVAWSPDDRQLAFTQFVPEAKKSMLNIPGKPEGAEWNAPPIFIDEMNYRGDEAGYLKPGKTQIFTLGIDGGTPRQRTFTSHNHGSPIWAKDGKSLFFSANLHENSESEPRNSEIYRLDLSSGEVKALTSRFGPDSSPILSPDGKMIAFTGYDDTFQGYMVTNLYIMNADGTGVKNLTADWTVMPAIRNGKEMGKGIYFQYDEFGDTKVGHVALTGKIRTWSKDLADWIWEGLTMPEPSRFLRTTASPLPKAGPEHPADLAIWNGGETKD
jgi:Tol biopolymer transport system component